MKRVILSLVIAAMVVSCGDNKPKKQTETQVQSSDNQSNETKIVLESTDQMTFVQKEISVKAGQKVTLTLKHIGKMKKEVMGHNFVLLKKDVNVANFATEAMKFPNNEYVPENSDQVIAHTKLIGGGEEVTITFDAPEAGTYDFICSFPGHYAIMKGKLVVQ